MSNIGAVDEGMPIDWGKTILDYNSDPAGPPPSFYERLVALGTGKAGSISLTPVMRVFLRHVGVRSGINSHTKTRAHRE